MNTTSEKIGDEINKSVHSEDQPLDKRAPGASFAVVALTYMLLLFVVVAILTALIYML